MNKRAGSKYLALVPIGLLAVVGPSCSKNLGVSGYVTWCEADRGAGIIEVDELPPSVGRPISNASVQLLDAAGKLVIETASNESGYFNLTTNSDPPRGKYTVRVKQDGKELGRMEIDLERNQVRHVIICVPRLKVGPK